MLSAVVRFERCRWLLLLLLSVVGKLVAMVAGVSSVAARDDDQW